LAQVFYAFFEQLKLALLFDLRGNKWLAVACVRACQALRSKQHLPQSFEGHQAASTPSAQPPAQPPAETAAEAEEEATAVAAITNTTKDDKQRLD
jgi:hypothetical protein